MRTKRILAPLLTLLALSITAHASAADAKPTSTQSGEYKRGYAALLAKDWNQAYDVFLGLWTQGSDSQADVAVNLGQAELMLGKYQAAAEHLSMGMLLAPPEDADMKERANRGLAFAKKKIGTLLITAPEGTEILINGKSVGTTPLLGEVFADPGAVTVIGRHPTQGYAQSKFEVSAAEERRIELQLKEPTSTTGTPLEPPYSSAALDAPPNNPTSALPPSPPPVEKTGGPEPRTLVLIAGSVVTVAALGSGTYFGLTARSARVDAEDLVVRSSQQFGVNTCATTTGANSDLCAQIASKNSDRQDAARAANISFAVAGVAAVATGLTYLLWPRSKPTTSGLRLVPVAAPRVGGLSLTGAF